jgi:hypothetical protein
LLRSANTNKEEIRQKQKENAAHLEKCADLFLKLNRLSAAESAYLLAFSLRVMTNSQSSEDKDHLSAVLLKLGNFYRYSRKNFVEAEKRYQAALRVLSNYRSTQSTLEGEALTHMGSLYANELKKPADGEELLKTALHSLATAAESEAATILTLRELNTLYLSQSRFSEAVEMAKRKLTVAHGLLKRTSAEVTGSGKWNAQDYSQAFSYYVRAAFSLGVAYRAAGDTQNAQAIASSLLDPELRVSVAKYRQTANPALAENLKTRLEVVAVRRKYIEALKSSAD